MTGMLLILKILHRDLSKRQILRFVKLEQLAETFNPLISPNYAEAL